MTSELKRKKLALIGLGPHAKRIYYPLIEKWQAEENLELSLLIELEDQRESVEKYLSERLVQPERIIYLPESARHGGPEFISELNRLAGPGELWGCIIATEPKAHGVYAQWAIEHGAHILIDKPLTAFSLRDSAPEEALRLVSDHASIHAAATRRGVNVLVQAQRRAHVGYEMIHEYLSQFMGAYEVPLTYVDIYHADGMWNMPGEYFRRENHPYKYGYGKIMHSGYHFIDLYAWMIRLNQRLSRTSCDRINVVTRDANAYDHLAQVDHQLYERFFAEAASAQKLSDAQLKEIQGFGETDVFLLLQAMRDDRVISTGSLNLLQTSFSRRAWPDLPADTYKGNGRVRHERVTIQVGHLLNVQVHSYQSYEAKDWQGDKPGVGQYDHFDISFYRNCQLVGGEPHELITLGDAMQRTNETDKSYIGHNEAARAEVFLDFLHESVERAGLSHHDLSIKLVAAAYYDILRRRCGELSSPVVDMAPGAREWFSDAAR
ncbi:hypothetical protein AB0K62_24680 [Streptomyces halstedii]|uniref:hypothetical protein n=1 Tax=Streptomyces halstedii TaxID=1944 RepID=UPI0034607467